MRVRPLLVLLASAVGAFAAEDSDPINDIRVGVSVMSSPSIQERISSGSGSAASYEWADMKSWNLRYEAMYLQGMSRRGRGVGGFTWGVGALYGNADVTPGRYIINDGPSTDNSRGDLTLRYREYGLSLAAGLATTPSSTSIGALSWELLPIVRGGAATIETVTPGFVTTKKSGRSWFYEGGIRGGLTLADNGFLLGVHVGWIYGRSRFDIDMGDGSSDLLLVRKGPEAGLELGVRF